MPDIVNAGVIVLMAGFAALGVVGAVDQFGPAFGPASAVEPARATAPEAVASTPEDETAKLPDVVPPAPLEDDAGDEPDDKRGDDREHGRHDRHRDDGEEGDRDDDHEDDD